MRVDLFDFDLPQERIALRPARPRDSARLLLVQGADVSDHRVLELPGLLRPRDVLVFNDTKVIPAQLEGRRGDARIGATLHKRDGPREWQAFLRNARRAKTGETIDFGEGVHASVVEKAADGSAVLHFQGNEPVELLLERAGRMPLPPYIAREAGKADAERYQTVYAREPGAVAAPTAGLHFDQPLLDALRAQGVEFGYITLHVGAGTFQPVRSESIEDHVMHREWLNVGAELVEQIRSTRVRGGRVIAVGTTVVRALEAARDGGVLKPFAGETRIFIVPGYRIESVDALITNFHLPESTLLMLVSALAGRELILDTYRHAVEQRYRFFSYGDAMLILPRGADA